ncbi:hypothetical protein HQ489_06195 [Candidatus Woesearchaeota archaeon]|nr:hypothetical protein [Candidatus Woesearchaeota archaeon]
MVEDNSLYLAVEAALDPENYDPAWYGEPDIYDPRRMDGLPNLKVDPPRHEDESLHSIIDIESILNGN